MLEQALLFTGCSNIQFFNSPPFPKHSQLGHTWYPTPQCVQPLYNFWMPYQVIAHQVAPTQLFLGKQTIFLGVASILRMSLCPRS